MAIFTMLIGLPGSGKSTYAAKLAAGSVAFDIISSDAIRQELYGDSNDQRDPGKVFNEMFIRSVAALKAGRSVIYDATNLIAKTRKSTLIKIRKAVDDDFSAVALFCACSLSECKRRQGDRERKVPNEVIDRMVRQFQTPWYNEGWDTIEIVDCGKKQNIDREHWRMLGESHDNPHHTRSLEMHCAECIGQVKDNLGVFNRASERLREEIQEAAYHHDIGKHKTKVFHDARGNPTEIAHYYNHENVGAYLWLTGDKIDQWTKIEFLFIALLIQWHMQPYFLRDENGEYNTKFFEWCNKRDFGPVFYAAICLIHEADKAAH